jgi:hypothetical protein
VGGLAKAISDRIDEMSAEIIQLKTKLALAEAQGVQAPTGHRLARRLILLILVLPTVGKLSEGPISSGFRSAESWSIPQKITVAKCALRNARIRCSRVLV